MVIGQQKKNIEKHNGINEAIDQRNGYSSPAQEAVHQAFLVQKGLICVCLRTILYVRASLVLIQGRYCWTQQWPTTAHPMCMCRMAGVFCGKFLHVCNAFWLPRNGKWSPLMTACHTGRNQEAWLKVDLGWRVTRWSAWTCSKVGSSISTCVSYPSALMAIKSKEMDWYDVGWSFWSWVVCSCMWMTGCSCWLIGTWEPFNSM